jgi:hypothetical protein
VSSVKRRSPGPMGTGKMRRFQTFRAVNGIRTAGRLTLLTVEQCRCEIPFQRYPPIYGL